MGSLPINLFDAAIYFCLAAAVIMGFSSGLLRSLATIFGYVAAIAAAVALAPQLSHLADQWRLPPWVVLVAVFLIIGVIIGALLRYFVSEIAGPEVGLVDRTIGAVLGAARILLLAVLIVVIFDRIIPAGREPTFLAESKLRPILSEAGRQGLRSLPPEVEAYIDRLKRERGI
jgi:membrane protein required for colicin V production